MCNVVLFGTIFNNKTQIAERMHSAISYCWIDHEINIKRTCVAVAILYWKCHKTNPFQGQSRDVMVAKFYRLLKAMGGQIKPSLNDWNRSTLEMSPQLHPQGRTRKWVMQTCLVITQLCDWNLVPMFLGPTLRTVIVQYHDSVMWLSFCPWSFVKQTNNLFEPMLSNYCLI